ncbi:hypothetical protein [Frateuria aurantia]|uniref:Bacteriophage head-tail adaptor n=1 Tax=Frateuria aurantia (strain ATCC 33424 / DSM 6220 / KCTC 2777 / LMG 1558 / NBRC 3245 / NCIMB 13370) TaxID=767434 RepID=H8L672_FRAAD|nr:hypothetical protein [Frateuria aurantia]AFC85916.1 hypothetical protein Fraau_1495 [Frateuria aurantia DSM 6220]
MRLNVSRVLASREFRDTSLVRIRNTQTVGDDGRAVNAQDSTPFSGVVTNDAGYILRRFPAASVVSGSILITSQTPLTSGTPDLDADIVRWRGQQYTVSMVNDYTTYGQGFTEAICNPLSLQGGADSG